MASHHCFPVDYFHHGFYRKVSPTFYLFVSDHKGYLDLNSILKMSSLAFTDLCPPTSNLFDQNRNEMEGDGRYPNLFS